MSNKYNAKPVVIDGHRFASKREAKRYGELKLRERAGEIRGLCVHPKLGPFVVNGRPVLIKSDRYPNGRKANYTADFSYIEDDALIIEDVKSKATDTEASRLRRALVEAIYGVGVRLV